MQTFIKSSYINCDTKSLFDFHLDTNNLTFITPPDTRVELLTKDFKPQIGQILKIKSTKYFIQGEFTRIWIVLVGVFCQFINLL